MSQFNARVSFHFKELKDLRKHNLLSEQCEMNTVVVSLETKLQNLDTELNFSKVQQQLLVCQLYFPAALFLCQPSFLSLLQQDRTSASGVDDKGDIAASQNFYQSVTGLKIGGEERSLHKAKNHQSKALALIFSSFIIVFERMLEKRLKLLLSQDYALAASLLWGHQNPSGLFSRSQDSPEKCPVPEGPMENHFCNHYISSPSPLLHCHISKRVLALW